jgi:GDSL-like Lipase/Acylhydrolase family
LCYVIDAGAFWPYYRSVDHFLLLPRRATWSKLALVGVVLLLFTSGSQNASVVEASSSPVYLSLGDGIQYGCCGGVSQSANAMFRGYIEKRLDRPVQWVTLAHSDPTIGLVTADLFVKGYQGHEPQLDRAVAALEAFRRDDRPVAAITLSIGGNDLVEVGNHCQSPPCLALYEQARSRMTAELDTIYGRINAAKDPATPLLVLTYYNASDCGQPGVDTSPTELGVRGWNDTIAAAATRNQAFLVDGYTPVRGRACQLVRGLDLNSEGQKLLARQYQDVYDGLPDSYVSRLRSPGVSQWALAGFLASVLALLAVLYVVSKDTRQARE